MDRTEDLREWVRILTSVIERVNLTYAFANNHYGGFAPHTIELFKRLWEEQAAHPP
jgi:uncharacterized protein YecE (DUF72 family)